MLEVKSLYVNYGARLALQDISLTLTPGNVVGLAPMAPAKPL